MTVDQITAFSVIGGALVLFAWGRWRYDLVALVALLVVVSAGLVPARDAFAGFAHPAVVTVAAVLVISRALRNAGIIDLVVSILSALPGREMGQLVAQSGTVGVLSAFMNNVGAMALMLPVALRTAYREGYPPAKILMPLAFSSLLGGLVTLIGTPPNVIIATFRAEAMGEAFHMFDFAPVGLPIAIVGLAFVTLVGWRLIPTERRGRPDTDSLFRIDGYVTEARVPEGSPVVDETVRQVEDNSDHAVTIAGIIRGKQRSLIPSNRERARVGDIFILEGDPTDLKSFIDDVGLDLVGLDHPAIEDLKSDDVGIVEAVVTPGSRLIGRTATSSRLRARYVVNLLAIARHGQPIRRRIVDVSLKSGDVLLLQGLTESLPDVLQRLGCLPLAERSLQIARPRRLILAAGMFGAAIASTLVGLLPVHIAFTIAVAVLVLTNVISLTEMYEAIDWPILVLLGAMIPVGAALETTGGAALVAQSLVTLTGGLGPIWALAILLVGTMFISDVINNNATAVLMAPIALGVANGLGVNPDSFLMAIAVGASCAFLTPIGHQSNTLVMEPGGYRFGDYWRMGLPLELIIAAVGVPMILLIWPL
tara:strand:+ start:17529 stop:19307 length:1779 start_codon:yes stop_codon:yes gene_type:complete